VSSIHTKRIENTIEDVRAGRVLLLELEPVAGAWGVVLATRCEWLEPTGYAPVTVSDPIPWTV
jgi:hypothetical protein